MGLFDRLSVVVRANLVVQTNLNEMIKQAENPEMVLEQVISNIQEALIQTKIAIAKVESIPNQKAKLNYDVALAEVSKWQENLRKAERDNKEQLIFYARERLENHQINAEIASKKLDKYTGESDTLNQNLVALEKKLSEAKSLKDRFLSSAASTQLPSPTASIPNPLDVEARLQNIELELETTRQQLLKQQEITTKLLSSNSSALKEVRQLLMELNIRDNEKNNKRQQSFSSQLGTNSALSILEQQEHDALIQVNSSSAEELLAGKDLEEELALLESGSDVDDELAVLKAQIAEM
jgi:phage shock protein A